MILRCLIGNVNSYDVAGYESSELAIPCAILLPTLRSPRRRLSNITIKKGRRSFSTLRTCKVWVSGQFFFMVLDVHPGACLGIPFEGWDLKWWSGAVLDSKTSWQHEITYVMIFHADNGGWSIWIHTTEVYPSIYILQNREKKTTLQRTQGLKCKPWCKEKSHSSSQSCESAPKKELCIHTFPTHLFRMKSFTSGPSVQKVRVITTRLM